MDPPPVTTRAPPLPALSTAATPTADAVKPENTTEPRQTLSPDTPIPPSLSPPVPSRPVAITIPSHSGWFSWTSIHETERKLLPEFFDGKSASRNPSNYKYLRDSIMRKYHESLPRKITFTEARKCLVADVGSVRRVFDFLETWGLINYTPLPVNKGSGNKGGEEKKGNAEDSVEKKEKQKESEQKKKICTGCGVVCSQACFAPEKQVDIILCARCFVRGNYRAGLTSGDFKRVDIGDGVEVGHTKSEWSDKETLHLLEAVLHHGDDWKKVAEHVGNGRSQRDCVSWFVKLPFGEQFMQPLDAGQANLGDSQDEGDDLEDSPLAKRIHLSPLADTSNPIMAQVAFLSAMVGSEVAEAASHAATKSLPEVDINSSTDMDYRMCELMPEKEGEAACENGHSNGSALKEAAAEARLRLKQESDELEQSISDIINIQMKEIQEKMVNFEATELMMEKERSQLQHMKNLLFADQLNLLQQKSMQRSLESTVEKTKTPL